MRASYVLVNDNNRVLEFNEKREYLIGQARALAKKHPGEHFCVYSLVWEGVSPPDGVFEVTR